MNKQQLASKIWAAANKMRSKIEAHVYKDYILGFIFYKFLSDQEKAFFIKTGMTEKDLKECLNENDEETVTYAQQNLGYFISYKHLFSTWIKNEDNDFSVMLVKEALSAFPRLMSKTHEKVFKDIFKTLDTGISNLGSTDQARTKAIHDLIDLINDIPMDGKQDYDVLGFVYEYLLANFAANAGKKAGEFYTPHEVSLLMAELVAEHLKDKEQIDIYDPTSGSGSLLITIGRAVSKHMKNKDCIKYYAQEVKEETFNLTRMNLVMRGILPDNIFVRNGDTLEDDWPFFEENDVLSTYRTLYLDAVVSNPPYSLPWDPKDKEVDPRYKQYGLAPASKADYAFLLHDLYHLKPDGIMTIVLPHGVLFRGGSEEEIRKNLIEHNNIDAIIGLPPNIFYGTGIPTIIMILKQKRTNTDVLIIDASKGFAKVGKNNKLRESDIKRIVDTVRDRFTIEKYSKVVSKEEIRQNEYNLNIPRYVDSSEKPESYDIYATMYGGIPNKEIEELKEYWSVFPTLKDQIFSKVNDRYSTCELGNIDEVVNNNLDVLSFKEKFNDAFKDFDSYLKSRLIDNLRSLHIPTEENIITENIFERLENVELVDKYHAYQLFSDVWQNISQDIEVLQTEGLENVTKVIPNMVIKKKDGVETEKQEGYKGLIIPFELIQNLVFKEKQLEISKIQDDLSLISSKIEEIVDEFDDTEKQDYIDEEKNSLKTQKIAIDAKKYKKQKEQVNLNESKIIELDGLIIKQKTITKEIKEKEKELHNVTKSYLEKISLEDGLYLLEHKWIKPIANSILNISTSIINDFITKINKLKKKYEETLIDIENNLNNTSKELNSLIDELVGDDFDMKGLQELKKLLGEE